MTIAVVGVWAASAYAAPAPSAPAPSPSGTPGGTPAPGLPIADIDGTHALWFIGIVSAAAALLWAIPLLYDTHQANRWRRSEGYQLIKAMIEKVPNPSVEEIRQIVSAIDNQPRGTRGLTQTLLSLIVSTLLGVALVASLLSAASDSSDIRKTIVTALLSILATIAGFYFGAKTSENATESAKRPPEATHDAPGGGGPESGDPTITGGGSAKGSATGGAR